jgi:nucleotide-binding universal stress UspA family protein
MTAQHILVPTDFSAYADQALDYAIDLAQALQARLILLHIIDTTPLGVVEGATGAPIAPKTTPLGLVEGVAKFPPSYWQELETAIEQRMDESLKRLHDAGLQGETVIVHGVPFQGIIDTAKEQGVDLIIMGTHGRTGLPHVLMGSVAENVVRLAPCPVLVLRGSTEASTAEEDAMPARP